MSSPGQDFAGGVTVLPSGDVVLAGGSYFHGTGDDKGSPNYGTDLYDGWIIALDGEGRRKWDVALGGDGLEQFSGIVATRDGRLLAVGGSTSPSGPGKTAPRIGIADLWVVALAADGRRLWERSFNPGSRGFGRAICLDSTTGCLVAGQAMIDGFLEGWLLHLDGQGHLLWERLYDAVFGPMRAIAVNSESHVFWTSENFWVGRANPTNGALLWSQRVEKGAEAWGSAALATRDGGLVAGGEFQSPASEDEGERFGLLSKWDAAGRPVWEHEFRHPGRLRKVTGVAECEDGGVLAVGHGGVRDRSTVIVRLTPEGQPLWWQSFQVGTEGWSHGCVRTPEGGWIILSSGNGPSPDRQGSSRSTIWDMWAVKIAPEQTWVQRDPPELLSSRFLGSHLDGGGFRFSLIGTKGQTYVTERSTDFARWDAFSTNTATETDIKLLDPAARVHPQVHYRSRKVEPRQ
ncbi:MAG: hypothetical protein J0L84_04480 [Verrucomicrobia bacterium]|nr:hypothetical protein [Verrucomicrobiota bacterium]